MEQILEPTNDLAWILESEGYDQLRQSSLDSRFAISNGFLGVKGGRVTTRGARSIPPARIYVAGLFDTAGIDHAIPGLVPAADWLQVRILLAGTPIVHHPGDLSSHRMTLDMRRGALLSHGHHSHHRPSSQLACRIAQRARSRATTHPIRNRGRNRRDHVGSIVRRDGPRTRLGTDRTGSLGVAYPRFG
jgi:trehalose/maltose hydrolase-like predicted phosphorylase